MYVLHDYASIPNIFHTHNNKTRSLSNKWIEIGFGDDRCKPNITNILSIRILIENYDLRTPLILVQAPGFWGGLRKPNWNTHYHSEPQMVGDYSDSPGSKFGLSHFALNLTTSLVLTWTWVSSLSIQDRYLKTKYLCSILSLGELSTTLKIKIEH